MTLHPQETARGKCIKMGFPGNPMMLLRIRISGNAGNLFLYNCLRISCLGTALHQNCICNKNSHLLKGPHPHPQGLGARFLGRRINFYPNAIELELGEKGEGGSKFMGSSLSKVLGFFEDRYCGLSGAKDRDWYVLAVFLLASNWAIFEQNPSTFGWINTKIGNPHFIIYCLNVDDQISFYIVG